LPLVRLEGHSGVTGGQAQIRPVTLSSNTDALNENCRREDNPRGGSEKGE